MDFVKELILDNLALAFLSLGLLLFIFLHKERRINTGIVVGLIGICIALGIITTFDKVMSQFYSELLQVTWSKGYVTIREYYTARGEAMPGTVLRHIIASIDYSLRPVTVMLLWLLTRKETFGRTFYFIIPCIVNAILAFGSYYTHWIFYFDEANCTFKLGSLYVLVYITSVFYGGLMVIEAINRYQQHLTKELIFIIFLLVSCGGIAIAESFLSDYVGTVLNVAIIGCVIFYYLFLQTKELEIALAEKEVNLQDRENSLKLSQIKPHFIFNTLTSIIDLCPEGSDAQEALVTFARYLRVNTDSVGNKRQITFEEELNNVKIFVNLEKYSYGDRLQVDYLIEPSSFLIPPLSVQPLVENSVKYCFKVHEKAVIIVWTKETDASYIIGVEDDGPGFDEVRTGSGHVGIENIRYRLREIAGASLMYRRLENGGTKATIIIPKEKASEDSVS